MNEFIFNIHGIALITPMIVILVFVVYRMTIFNNHQLSDTLLNAFLLTIVISAMGTIVLWNEAFTIAPIIASLLPYFLMSSLAAQAPILYLYIQSVTQDDFRFKTTHLFHTLPVVACVTIIVVFSLEHIDLQPGAYNQDLLSSVFIVRGLWDIVRYTSLGYAVVCLVIVWRLSKVANSPLPHRVDTPWLLLLSGGFLFLCSWSLVIQLFGRYIGGSITDFIGVTYNYLFFIYIHSLGACYLWCYKNRPTFAVSPNNKRPTLLPFGVDDIAKVSSGMEEKQHHLEANISLENFSGRVGLPVRTVSGIINKHFGQNFLDYLNGYRINTAKTILTDPAKADSTVLDIMYMSGFSSTSSFHRYFKRLEGITPTEYRRINSRH